jgi:hypothetical protein
MFFSPPSHPPLLSSSSLFPSLPQVALTMSTVMDAAVVSVQDRQRLTALLEQSQEAPSGAPTAAAYENHSTGIMDLLAELKVKAEGELAEVRKAEMEKKHRFEMLAQSLNDQIATQTRDQATAQATLEAKQEAVGEAQGDLAATSKTLGEDKKFLSKAEQTCAASAARNEENNQARAAELEALSQAIQILSGDKFVAAAGRRLPGESFLQTSTRSAKPAVVRLLQRVASRTHSEQIALA